MLCPIGTFHNSTPYSSPYKDSCTGVALGIGSRHSEGEMYPRGILLTSVAIPSVESSHYSLSLPHELIGVKELTGLAKSARRPSHT